jgi:late competence protein required for DNA uptake (superfamily II DNA/RNA helicase)
LFHPISNNGRPLIEPRIINTRINVNEDLPLVVYDYISWSIFSGKKVIIYVPDDEKVENISNYLLNFKDQLTKNIYIYKRTQKNKNVIEKFKVSVKGIIITDCFEQEEMELQEVNVMVFFADNELFDYKKLVYLTSRANKCLSESREEVIFLSNETSEEMDKAKDILRELNRKAWEEGFLNI